MPTGIYDASAIGSIVGYLREVEALDRERGQRRVIANAAVTGPAQAVNLRRYAPQRRRVRVVAVHRAPRVGDRVALRGRDGERHPVIVEHEHVIAGFVDGRQQRRFALRRREAAIDQ